MKKIFFLCALLSIGCAARAQSGNEQRMTTDSTHRSYRSWHHHDAYDSLHQGRFQPFHNHSDGAMNRFGQERPGFRDRDHQYRYGQGRFGGDRDLYRGNPEGFHRTMLAGIHLTPEQRKKMQAIRADYQKKSRELYKKDELTLGQYKSQLLVLQKERKIQMQNLLTVEQKKSLEAFKKHADENAQVRAAAKLERLKIRLNLSEEQAAKIKSQQQSMHLQMQTIRENENLMPPQKMEQIKSLASKSKEDLKSVLTPEQLRIYENMHNHRMDGR